jgi:3-methyladenine DNA glycosylase AlkC
MAEPLKNMYNPQFFEGLCPVMRENIPGFDCRDFIFRVFNNVWPDLELKERVRHIALTLHHFMPEDFPASAQILIRLSKALRTSGVREQSFATIFIPDYVEVFGLGHPDESLNALEEITRLVSAEFAIRHFLIKYPGQTIQKMLQWSKHADASVRRLASEGSRPRLPWAIGLPDFKKDPARILPILENLKSDPSEYVRRSVANNLNDIGKDHPELVLRIAKKWKGKNPDTDRLIKHACRSLLKKGHHDALSLHGFNSQCKAKVKSLSISKTKIRIGENLNFDFQFVSEEKKTSDFRLEYSITYVTSTGKTSTKIFKITENKFAPKAPVEIQRKQSFKNLTTRKHFKGKHHLSILANGKKLASKEFFVV